MPESLLLYIIHVWIPDQANQLGGVARQHIGCFDLNAQGLEAFVQNSTEKGISLIYETQTEDGLFNGLRLIEKQYEYREN